MSGRELFFLGFFGLLAAWIIYGLIRNYRRQAVKIRNRAGGVSIAERYYEPRRYWWSMACSAFFAAMVLFVIAVVLMGGLSPPRQ